MTFLIHSISETKHNSNYNRPEEVKNAEGLLTFDGVYRNVYENKHLLEGKDVILFVTGNYVGGNNYFDVGMPLEKFCTWNELFKMQNDGAEIGWHTWTHPDLTKLNDEELEREVTPPFPMNSFAYPYGRFDERVIKAVKKAGFKEAWSVTEGDGSQYQKLRKYL